MSTRALLAAYCALALGAAACGSDTSSPGRADPTTTSPSSSTTALDEQPPSSLAPDGEATGAPTVAVTGAGSSSTTPSTEVASTEPTTGSEASTTTRARPVVTLVPVVDWSNVVPAEVVASLDEAQPGGGRLRAWLLRFDDRLTLDVAQGMALEAMGYGIVDENGALELFAESSWAGVCDVECLRPEDVGGAATLMEALLIGGYFGDHDPDPVAPDGTTLILRTFSGTLGSEPPDQIEYLVGSGRLGPLSVWEERIAAELPGLGPDEYLAAIAFDHACGTGPAGACG